MSINNRLFNSAAVPAATQVAANTVLLDAARMLHAATGGKLVINFVPKDGRTLFMGTPYGMNLLAVTFVEVKYGTATGIFSMRDYWTLIRAHEEIAVSKKLAYLKRRFTLTSLYRRIMDQTDGYFTEAGTQKAIADYVLRPACSSYVSKLTSAEDVDLSSRVSFSTKIDEWLLRYYAGITPRNELPHDVVTALDGALTHYQRRLDFLNRAEDLIGCMFGREKWLLLRQYHGTTVIGLDTRGMVSRIKQGLIANEVPRFVSDNTAYFKFTYQPRFFSSIQDIDDAQVRSSILSAMALVKASRAYLYPGQEAAGMRDSDGLFTRTGGYMMSNEAGWMEELEVAGLDPRRHYLIIDKD